MASPPGNFTPVTHNAHTIAPNANFVRGFAISAPPSCATMARSTAVLDPLPLANFSATIDGHPRSFDGDGDVAFRARFPSSSTARIMPSVPLLLHGSSCCSPSVLDPLPLANFSATIDGHPLALFFGLASRILRPLAAHLHASCPIVPLPPSWHESPSHGTHWNTSPSATFINSNFTTTQWGSFCSVPSNGWVAIATECSAPYSRTFHVGNRPCLCMCSTLDASLNDTSRGSLGRHMGPSQPTVHNSLFLNYRCFIPFLEELLLYLWSRSYEDSFVVCMCILAALEWFVSSPRAWIYFGSRFLSLFVYVTSPWWYAYGILWNLVLFATWVTLATTRAILTVIIALPSLLIFGGLWFGNAMYCFVKLTTLRVALTLLNGCTSLSLRLIGPVIRSLATMVHHMRRMALDLESDVAHSPHMREFRRRHPRFYHIFIGLPLGPFDLCPAQWSFGSSLYSQPPRWAAILR